MLMKVASRVELISSAERFTTHEPILSHEFGDDINATWCPSYEAVMMMCRHGDKVRTTEPTSTEQDWWGDNYAAHLGAHGGAHVAVDTNPAAHGFVMRQPAMRRRLLWR